MKWLSDSVIAHDAIVQSIDSSSVRLLLLNKGSCSGCNAGKSCGMSGSDTRELSIEGTFDVSPGSRVTVVLKQSSGFLALFLGYLLPLLIFLVSLVLLNIFSVDELASGLISLGMFIPYYLLLSLFRSSIRQKFSFTINDPV
jgi:sigma-E factor negative regulatory protein RseC